MSKKEVNSLMPESPCWIDYSGKETSWTPLLRVSGKKGTPSGWVKGVVADEDHRVTACSLPDDEMDFFLLKKGENSWIYSFQVYLASVYWDEQVCLLPECI